MVSMLHNSVYYVFCAVLGAAVSTAEMLGAGLTVGQGTDEALVYMYIHALYVYVHRCVSCKN